MAMKIIGNPNLEELDKELVWNIKKQQFVSQQPVDNIYQDNQVNQEPEKKQGLLSRIGKDTLNLFLRIGEGALDVGDFLFDTMMQVSTSKANPYYWFNPDELKSHQAIARELIKSSGTEYTKEKLGYTDKLQQKLNENTTFGTDDFAGQVVRAIGTEVTKAVITGGLSGGNAMTAVKLSPVISGVQGYGTGIEEAYQSGVENRTTANIAGIANAAVEFITEKIIPGSPGFRNLPEGIRTIKQALKDYGMNIIGEGFEEALASVLNPIVNEYIYTGKKEDNVLEKFISGVSKIDPKQVLLDGIAGMLVAGFLDSPQLMGNIQTVQQDKKANEAKQKFQENVIQQLREERQQELNEFINDKNIDDSLKVKRIDDEIELINTTLTSDIRTNKLDIEGLYNKKQELIKQRDELSKKLNEKQKIEIINELSDDVNETINKAEETLNDAEVEVVQDKIEHIEKLTEEIDKNKKIKVAANKQKIKVNAKQHINEAAVIIEQMNMKLQEGQKPIQIVTELNDEQRQIMDLGSVFGKQVIFTENMPESGLVAQNNPNILFIDTKATTQLVSNKQGTTLYVLGHELFHSLKEVNPETYTQFVDYVKQDVTIEQIIDFVQKYDSENSNNILDSLKIEGDFKLDDVKRHYLKYKQQNQTLGMIVEEMVANEFGGMLTDKTYMNNLYQSNPSLFSKVVNALRELFKSITGSVYNSSLTQLQVEKIRNDFENIVKEIQQKDVKNEQQKTKQKKLFDTDDEYVYHLDYTNSPVESFAKYGIKPSKRGRAGPGVYMANTEFNTIYNVSDVSEGTMYRIKKKDLIDKYGLYDSENKTGNLQFDESEGEILLSGGLNVAPELLEVRQNGKWIKVLNTNEQQEKTITKPTNDIKNETKSEIDFEKKIQDVKPEQKDIKLEQEEVKPEQKDVKVSKMDLDTWFKSINNMYQKYLKTKDKDRFSGVIKAYENYKRQGGTENIIEIDNYLQEQQEKKKQETIELMRKALMTKKLPKNTPSEMKRQLFNREITIPEGMSLGEAIEIYRKNPNNKRLLTRTITPLDYAKDVTINDIGKTLELNRVELLNPKNIKWNRATGMFGKGMYFSLDKRTTKYYEYEYKDAKYLVDKYDVDTKNMFILQLKQIYNDKGQYLKGRYGVSPSDELSDEMIKQKILTEQERNKIKAEGKHLMQTYNDILKEKGYKGIAVFVHPTDNKNGEVTYFGGNQLVLFDTSKATRKDSQGYIKNYEGKMNIIKYLPKSETKESSFYSNTAKTNANDLFSDVLKVAENNPELRNYLTTSHDKDMRTAITQIRENPSQTIQDFLSKEKMTSVDTATAKILMMYYKSKNDVVNQLAVYRKIKTAGTEAGQFIESIKIFKNMSPEAIVQGVIQDIQSTIDALQNHPNREIQAWINENMNRAPLTDAEQDWIYQMANKALKLDADSAEYRRAFALINKFVADRIPKSIASQLKAYRRIAMLFNLKTANRNILGNVTMALPNAFADTMGSFVDKRLSKKTGVRTQGTMNMKTSALSFIQGVKDANLDRKLGINTSRNNVAFEITQGSSFNTKTKLGRTMNKIEELTNFIMDIGDRPFDVMYYENSLQNQMKLNGVTEPTESMKQIALEEAQKKTYKYEGKFYNFANNARKWLNGIGIKEGKLVYDKNGKTEFGLGDIIMPFIMTPANILEASYHYSPMAVMSVAKNAKAYTKAIKTGQNVEFAQKALSDSIGKMTAGVALYAIGFMLAKSGITSGGEDEDKDVKATMRAMGYQPFSINIGDYSLTYDWMQPLANPIALFAELERQRKINENNPNPDKKLDNALKVIAEAFTIGADRLYEQSMLSGLRTIFGGNFGTQSITEGFVSFLSGIPQSFIPTLSKQLADMLDGTTKDTYSNDSLLYNTFSKFFVKIPGVKSALPSRKTILGEDMKMYGGENNLFNVMINPANISKDTTGIIGQEIMDVFNHTGDKTIFPQVVVNYIDYDVNGDGIVDRITFTPEQKSNLQERMGTIVAEGMKEILNNSVYVNSSYEQKAKALTALMQYSKAKAIEQSNYVPNYEIKSGNASQINKYTNEGLNIGDAVMYDSIINSIQGMKDSNGDSIKGSENGIKAWTIMNMQISDEAKNIMLRLISPTAKNPETVDSLQKLGTKQQFIDYYALPRSDTFVNNKFSRDDYDISTKYFNIDGTIYTKFANDVSQIKADYNSKGEAIPNSRKNKVFSYINSLPLNQYQKIYLFSASGYSIKQWKNQMFSYINSLDISANEKKELWTSLGFE